MNVNETRPDDRRSWKHEFTGGLVHVQVKSGASYVARQGEDYFEIKVANLDAKRRLWQRSPLPIALIYVKEESLGRVPTKAWWADLKSPDSYTPNGTVIVPRTNRFQAGIECRRPFARIAIGQHRRVDLETIEMWMPWSLPGGLDQMAQSTKCAAREFYRLWKSVGAVNPRLGPVIINRTGWSHMTRVGRPVARIQRSFELLPAAARIVATIKTWRVLRRGEKERDLPDSRWAIYDYLGLSAMVRWPAREPSEVMVILRRQTTFAGDRNSTDPRAKVRFVGSKTWLYSVYEPGRRRRWK
jgi:hypothetical protein